MSYRLNGLKLKLFNQVYSIRSEKLLMKQPLLKIKINKSFLFKKVLKDISFKLMPGRFYTLVGENGAGKSTMFKIIVGLEYANSGSGSLLGENLTEVTYQNKHR